MQLTCQLDSFANCYAKLSRYPVVIGLTRYPNARKSTTVSSGANNNTVFFNPSFAI